MQNLYLTMEMTKSDEEMVEKNRFEQSNFDQIIEASDHKNSGFGHFLSNLALITSNKSCERLPCMQKLYLTIEITKCDEEMVEKNGFEQLKFD